MITTEQIKALRDKTGISVMQCKKALEETKGDEAKALIILQKKGAEIAAKKAERSFGSGTVTAYVHSNGSVAAMVELSSETDFVSNNADFRALAHDIAMQVAATNPEFLKSEDITPEAKKVASELFLKETEGKPVNLKEKILEGKLNAYFADKVLLEQPFIKDPDVKIKGLIDSAIQKFGEKIAISRIVRFKVGE